MARQDPWDLAPVVPLPSAETAQPERGQVVRRPDGSSYIVASREFTNETATELLNQGYEKQPDGVWAKTVGTVAYEDAPWNQAPEVEIAPPLLSGPVEAFSLAAAEQIPFLDEAAAGTAALLTGNSYGEVRDLQRDLQSYDRENYGAARNAGGIAGFTAGLVAPGGAYVQNARGAQQVLRAGQVGAAYGGLYGAGAADGDLADRAVAGGIGALAGGIGGAGLTRGGQALGNYAQRLGGIASINTRTPSPVAQRVADLESLGITPTLAGAGGPMSQRTAQTLAGNIVTGQPIAQAAQRVRGETVNALENVASQYGTAEGVYSAGRTLQRASQEGADALRREGGVLYEPINALEANPTPIPLTRSAEAVNTALEVFQTPELRDWFTRNSTDLQDFGRILNREDNTVTFAEARRLRSIVGSMLKDPQVFQSRSEAGLRSLYGALSDDITSGAQQLGGPEAAAALGRADTFYSAARTRADDVLSRFYNANTPTEAYARLLDSARSTGRRSDWAAVRQLRDSVNPEDWNEIGSGIIRSLGGEGENFSVAKFATEWEKLTPQARRALFGGEGRTEQFQALNTLARVARDQTSATRFYNNSESGNVVNNIGSGGAFLGALMTGNTELATAIAGAGALGNGLARLLTNPDVARWVAGGTRTAVRDAERIARRDAAFGGWWNLNRDAVTRLVAQNDNLPSLPMQSAAEEDRAQR